MKEFRYDMRYVTHKDYLKFKLLYVKPSTVIDKVFWYRVHKLKEIKHYAKQKNLPVWHMPVIDSIMICILGSIYISDYLVGSIPSDGWFAVVSPYMPLVLFTLFFLTVMDLVAKAMVNVHITLIKLVHGGITKIDHYIWKRTKKDNVISTKILNFQLKYMALPKSTKRRLKILLVLMIILYVTIRLF